MSTGRGRARDQRHDERREKIAIVACYKAQRRGFANSGELDDWLSAERDAGEEAIQRFVGFDACAAQLGTSSVWVREPLSEWALERWEGARDYRYRVDGAVRHELSVVRHLP